MRIFQRKIMDFHIMFNVVTPVEMLQRLSSNRQPIRWINKNIYHDIQLSYIPYAQEYDGFHVLFVPYTHLINMTLQVCDMFLPVTDFDTVNMGYFGKFEFSDRYLHCLTDGFYLPKGHFLKEPFLATVEKSDFLSIIG